MLLSGVLRLLLDPRAMEDGLPLLQVFRPIVDYWPLIQHLLSIERFV